MTFFGAILGIVIIIALVSWIVGYNALIKYLNWVEDAWAQIDTQLNHRFNLIPRLIDVVQQHIKNEQHTLEKLVELRSQLASPNNDRNHQMNINEELSETLFQVFALEEVSELRKDEEFTYVEKHLKETDLKIKKAAKIYNNTVVKYNTKIQSPPTSFVANIHNFHKRETITLLDNQNSNIKMSS
ncbi:LemA family protein [Alteribacillus bidgolensis]|uniref:LemA protein n=1 Tax=Alteribacillus bidgolensis TaxID=930129 RepID=A0A1G8N0R8_9BACI|nr:LemA family protein [Alteribacillus bidgolensis]SDI73861.1 LemA protein [Alteribacillus bidgolensis]